MLPNQPLSLSDQSVSQPVCFSFTNHLNKCIEVKKKSFFFTNKIPLKNLRGYRNAIDKAFCDWSTKTISRLEGEKVCYRVGKEKINETRNNIAKVFRMAEYNEEWKDL